MQKSRNLGKAVIVLFALGILRLSFRAKPAQSNTRAFTLVVSLTFSSTSSRDTMLAAFAEVASYVRSSEVRSHSIELGISLF